MAKIKSPDVVEEQPRRIALKFRDGFSLPYEDGAENDLPGEWKESWAALDRQFPGISLKRVFTTVPPERIKELVEQAVAQNKEYIPPDFLTFFAIDMPSLEQADGLVQMLKDWTIIDYAYVESLPSLPITQPQHYIEPPLSPPAPPTILGSYDIGGINAVYAWTHPGGTGSGVNFIDIEKGWCLMHPDLLTPAGAPKISAPINSFNWGLNINEASFDYTETQHGTSVLGILAANDNATQHSGWKGIAHGATGRVISPWVGGAPNPVCDPQSGQAPAGSPGPYGQPGDWSVPDAITAANAHLDPGDVMLLELETMDHWPIETEPQVFAAIEAATQRGVIVVEPAGNGNSNIDPKLTSDSGAIIVGAAVPKPIGANLVPHTRLTDSNFGTKVHCFAWGNTVYSLNVNLVSGDPGTVTSPYYTTNFSGTSAASAIIAGAALIVQGVAKAHQKGDNPTNKTYLPGTLRTILVSNGTQSDNPAVDLIGVMPDLNKIIQTYMMIGQTATQPEDQPILQPEEQENKPSLCMVLRQAFSRLTPVLPYLLLLVPLAIRYRSIKRANSKH